MLIRNRSIDKLLSRLELIFKIIYLKLIYNWHLIESSNNVFCALYNLC